MKKIAMVVVSLIIAFSLIGIVIKGKNKIDLSSAKPGDIILMCNSRSSLSGYWDHVAIYIGNGELIEAVYNGVKIYPIKRVYEKDSVIILRVNTTDEIKERAIEFAKSKIDYPFKKNPLKFNRQQGDSYYCSELIWASYYNASNGSVDLDFFKVPLFNPVSQDELSWSKYTYKISGGGTFCHAPPTNAEFFFFYFDKVFKSADYYEKKKNQ